MSLLQNGIYQNFQTSYGNPRINYFTFSGASFACLKRISLDTYLAVSYDSGTTFVRQDFTAITNGKKIYSFDFEGANAAMALTDGTNYYLYFSTDYGDTYTDVTANIPNATTNDINKPISDCCFYSGRLFVSYYDNSIPDFRYAYSDNSGSTYTKINDNPIFYSYYLPTSSDDGLGFKLNNFSSNQISKVTGLVSVNSFIEAGNKDFYQNIASGSKSPSISGVNSIWYGMQYGPPNVGTLKLWNNFSEKHSVASSEVPVIGAVDFSTVLMSYGGLLKRSTDSGSTFTTIITGGTSIDYIKFNTSSNGVFQSQNSSSGMCYTMDGGATWAVSSGTGSGNTAGGTFALIRSKNK